MSLDVELLGKRSLSRGNELEDFGERKREREREREKWELEMSQL